MVTRVPVWRRSRGRLAAVVAVAAAIIAAAVVIPLNLGGGQNTPAQAVTVVIPLRATTAAKVIGDGAATARATARQAGASWTFVLSVHGLKVLPGNDIYECWWSIPGSTKAHPTRVSGGTFVVDNSGSTILTMTTGVDHRQFRTMEITAESPGTGALLERFFSPASRGRALARRHSVGRPTDLRASENGAADGFHVHVPAQAPTW